MYSVCDYQVHTILNVQARNTAGNAEILPANHFIKQSLYCQNRGDISETSAKSNSYLTVFPLDRAESISPNSPEYRSRFAFACFSLLDVKDGCCNVCLRPNIMCYFQR